MYDCVDINKAVIENQWGCQNGTLLSLDEIAKELNMSKRNLQRALRIERNLYLKEQLFL